VRKDCEDRLVGKKKDFQAMKHQIEEINQEEQKLKDAFD